MKQAKTSSFNIIDVLIIILALAVVGVCVYVFFIAGSQDTEKVLIDYTIEMDVVRSEFNGLIKVGDSVISTVARDALGTVVNVQYKNATSTTTNLEDGAMKVTDYPEGIYSKLLVTIRSEAVYEKNAYYVGTIGLFIGSTVYFRVPDFIGGAVCLNVVPVVSGSDAQ